MLLVPVYLILLFPLIVVSFSPSVFLFRCVLHTLPLPLSSCLGCIPPLIGLPSLRFYAVGSSLFLLSVCFCLCFLFYRDDVLCWLLPYPSFSVCFPCLSPIPGLIWFGSVYLVTTCRPLLLISYPFATPRHLIPFSFPPIHNTPL